MIGYSEFKSSPLNSSGFLPEQLGLTTVIKILVPIPFDLDLTFESSSDKNDFNTNYQENTQMQAAAC